jgi:excisionase family DNA binding protein
MPSETETTPRRKKARTYLPDSDSRDDMLDLVSFFRDLDRFRGTAGRASLKAPDGTERELPDELFEALEQVAIALASGNGVTVAPFGMQLTTQEAADFLGVSRPTLVKLLTTGAIPYELRGRHRRVTLRDLVAYQDAFRVDRRRALRDAARDSQSSGMSSALPDEFTRPSTRDE